MSEGQIAPSQRLDVLHDHYKETFARQRELERSRDRLFLWVIVLFAVLAVAITYPTEFTGSVQSITLLGTEIRFGQLPLAALISGVWMLTFALTLRYCQVSILIDRQYGYVHTLEEHISPMVGGGDLYRREGEVYLRDYPILFNVAFYAYTITIPIILVVAALGLWLWEHSHLETHWLHKMLDLVLAVSIVVSLVLYRMQPYLARKIAAFWSRDENANDAR